MSTPNVLATGAWRTQAPAWVGLMLIVGLCWAYLVRMQIGMMAMMPAMQQAGMAMPRPTWAAEWAAAFSMWSVMMAAMMLPTTTRSLAVLAAMTARRGVRTQGAGTLVAACFVLGYMAAWIGYSVAAATAQVALSHTAMLTPMLRSANVAMSALILFGAGLFQFSALKEACLAKCRTPLGFFLSEWRDGRSGAFVMGLRQGAACVGCCWALMAVMLVVGAMNVFWMAALAAFMLAEKLVPAGWQLSRVAGVVFVLWGAWLTAGMFG